MHHQCAAIVTPGATEQIKDKGKQREGFPASSRDDSSPPTSLDSNDNSKLWKLLMHARGRHTTSEKKPSVRVKCGPSPEVVEAHTGSLSQAQAGPSSHAMSRQVGISVMRSAAVLTTCSRSHLVFLQYSLTLIFPNVPTRPQPAICGTLSFRLGIANHQMSPSHCNNDLIVVSPRSPLDHVP